MHSKYLIALATVITSLCTGMSDCYCMQQSNDKPFTYKPLWQPPSYNKKTVLNKSGNNAYNINKQSNDNIAYSQYNESNQNLPELNINNDIQEINEIQNPDFMSDITNSNNNTNDNTIQNINNDLMLSNTYDMQILNTEQDANNTQQQIDILTDKIDKVNATCELILSTINELKEKLNVQQPSNPPIKPKFSKRASIAQTTNYTSNSTTSQSSNPIQPSDHYKPQVLTTSVYSTQASSPYNTEPRPQYKAPYINQQPLQYQPSQNYNLRTSTYGSQYIPPSTTVPGY